MYSIFHSVMIFGLQASFLVLAVVILRLILRKAPRFIICALWALVAVRLIFPFDIQSIFGVVPRSSEVSKTVGYYASETVRRVYPNIDSIPLTTAGGTVSSSATASGDAVSAHLFYIASIVWVIGVAAMLIYAVISYIRLYRLTKESVKTEDCYLCDKIQSPFILGIFRPRIILPYDIAEEDKPYVLAHERAHIKRRDYLWKPLGFLLLSVYWFNPLLWFAYILLCRDIESACDEKVIKELGFEVKKPYANALINAAAPKTLIAACPVAFGETGVKSRVKNILSYKKPAFWIIIVAIILSIVVAVCFLTNPAEKNVSTPDSSNNLTETEPDAELQKLEPIEGVNSFFRVNYQYFANPAPEKEWNWSRAKAEYYGGTYLDGAVQVIMLTNTENIDSFKPVGREIRYEKCEYSLSRLEADIDSINEKLSGLKSKNEGYSESVVEIAILDDQNRIEVCIYDMTDDKMKWFKDTFGDSDEVVFRNVTTKPDEDISEKTVKDIPAVIFTNGETVYISGECGIIFYDIENGNIKGMLSPGYIKDLGYRKLYATASADGSKIFLYDVSDPAYGSEKCGVFDLTSGLITTSSRDYAENEDIFFLDVAKDGFKRYTMKSSKDGVIYELSVPDNKLKNMELTVKTEDGKEKKYKIFE